MISDEAVEAALEASLRQLGLSGKELPEDLVKARRKQLTELLEAAAPILLAGLRAQLVDYQKMLLEQSKEAEVFGCHATGVGIAIRFIDEIEAPL